MLHFLCASCNAEVMFLVRFQADQYNRLKNDTSRAVGEKKKVKFYKHLCLFCLLHLA